MLATYLKPLPAISERVITDGAAPSLALPRGLRVAFFLGGIRLIGRPTDGPLPIAAPNRYRKPQWNYDTPREDHVPDMKAIPKTHSAWVGNSGNRCLYKKLDTPRVGVLGHVLIALRQICHPANMYLFRAIRQRGGPALSIFVRISVVSRGYVVARRRTRPTLRQRPRRPRALGDSRTPTIPSRRIAPWRSAVRGIHTVGYTG